jgi:hypothetical protein
MPKASFFFAACLLATILFAFNAHSTPIILPSAAAICMLISMGVWQAEAARFTLTGKQLASLDSVLVTSDCGLHDDGVIYTGMNPAGTAIRSAGFSTKLSGCGEITMMKEAQVQYFAGEIWKLRPMMFFYITSFRSCMAQ